MQDKFVGDICDFAKFGLLRRLCVRKFASPFAPLRVGVVWYFVKGAPALARPSYLDRRDEFRACDSELFEAFENIADGDRVVSALEKPGLILPRGTSFFRSPVPLESGRGKWLESAFHKIKSAQAVFLDPDTGIIPSSEGASDEHAYWEEADFFWKRGCSLVIYQHPARTNHHAQMDNARKKARGMLSLSEKHLVPILRFRRRPNPFFVLVPQKQHAEQFEAAVSSMTCGKWGRHFSRH